MLKMWSVTLHYFPLTEIKILQVISSTWAGRDAAEQRCSPRCRSSPSIYGSDKCTAAWLSVRPASSWLRGEVQAVLLSCFISILPWEVWIEIGCNKVDFLLSLPLESLPMSVYEENHKPSPFKDLSSFWCSAVVSRRELSTQITSYLCRLTEKKIKL